MKKEVIEVFKDEGLNEEQARLLIKDVGFLEVKRKELVALEIAHRNKLVQEAGQCSKCPRRDMLTVDHVIPKDLLQTFGVDPDKTFIKENLVLLCRPCNSLKSNRLDFALPQTKPMLQRLLDRL